MQKSDVRILLMTISGILNTIHFKYYKYQMSENQYTCGILASGKLLELRQVSFGDKK